MKSLLDYRLDELKALMEKLGEKPFRATQLFDWIYVKGVLEPASMTNLPHSLRDKLVRDFVFMPMQLSFEERSVDGSIKVLFQDDETNVEAVALPNEGGRTTYCLSTQSGCPADCRFCATGKLGFHRNLSTGEIIYQVLALEKIAGRPDNIVLMGMGEPLLNSENVADFIRIITDPRGYALSERRITLSTAGLIDELRKFHAEFPRVELAISLNAPDNETRKELMPFSKLASFDDIIRSIKDFDCDITLEYVMLKGVNDSITDAGKLSNAIRRFNNVKVNLIAFNTAGDEFKSPGRERMIEFQNVLKKHGTRCFIRRSMGSDINAACGQLAGSRKK